MALCNLTGIDEVLAQLEKLADTDTAVNDMLTAGGEIVNGNLKEAIEEAANRGYATGALKDSIVTDPVIVSSSGSYVLTRPAGEDSKGVRNGEKYGYLEHGNGGTQEPHPFEDKVKEKSESECAQKMQEILNKYVNQ